MRGLLGLPDWYEPLVSPLPLWDAWVVLIVPLCLAVAVVYKSIKLEDARRIGRQSVGLTLWMLGTMFVIAVVIYLLVALAT